ARIVSIDSSEAEKMPGVLAVLHHGNTEKLFRAANSFEEGSRPGESRPPFEDDQVYYYGQFVALVVADTFERAQAAAGRVVVKYDSRTADVSNENLTPKDPPAVKNERGDFTTAIASAPVKLDVTYETPVETHNPMEMHAAIAHWNKEKLTLYETSQGVVNHRNVAAEMLNIPREAVQVISRFIGSGFGSKLFPWPHSWMAALAAKQLKRPVKVSVPRSMMFTTVGHRPFTRQHIQLGAGQDGKLVAFQHQILQPTSMVDDFVENCAEATSMLYSCPNLRAVQHIVHKNIGTPTPMRGPGRTPSLFGIESAMDELAVKLNIDPIEVRLRNYAEMDEGSKKPFSSKHLREAYQLGAEKFEWSRRNAKVGSMTKGKEILGWGMATCTWPATRHNAEVRVSFLADGTVRAVCATQDIGTGTYTVFAEIISDRSGVPLDKIQVKLGDSSLPPGPTSGGSAATATVIPAIAKATDQAMNALVQVAAFTSGSPFEKADPKSLKMSGGKIHKEGDSPDGGTHFTEILKLRKLSGLDGQARTEAAPEARQFSMHSFGAHFCEVAYDPGIAKLRVSRWLSVIDGGRIINHKTARNQILGSVVMGIGMAMLEETIYDQRNGKPVNNNYADYLVAVNTDIPEIDCLFLDFPDTKLNEYGARGIGEIGLTGCASAVTNAVYHATGVRVRELPVRIEKLLTTT
ncbi:MAG TPA: xanthine dehydrogenase family protein molybdopterin-binding subunit, partial [Candidatus Acidoferrum sp.]